jgi:ribosomal protein S12 methylthiotransferase accessory factor
MSSRPQLKRHFRCETVSSEEVLLLSERERFLLRGAAYPHVVPLLDGRHSVDEIIHQLRGLISPAEVVYAVGLLRRSGYIGDAISSIPSAQAALWELLDVDPQDAVLRLQDTTVSVVSYGAVDPAPFVNLILSAGVQINSGGRFHIVLTDDYLHNELETFNLEALDQKHPWMLVKPVGAELWIGPLFLPRETGCWACLAHRLQGARKVENYLQEKKNVRGPFPLPPAAFPSTIQTAYGIAVTEILKWLACGKNNEIEGQLISLNILSFSKNTHRLVQRPQCPCCGNSGMVAAEQSEPLTLQSCRKAFTADGGHRVFSPEEAVEGLAHHVSPITGIVSLLESHAGKAEKRDIAPSYIAGHNFVHISRNNPLDLDFLWESLRSASGGKGKEEAQAKASAVCEAIERYSGVFQGDEARICARLKDLGNAGVHPNSCMLFSERQITNREGSNAEGMNCDWAPEPFDEDREIEWSPAWSLTYNERRWLPMAYCYYGYSRKYHTWFTRADPNGCAAGCTKEEAVLHGFLELVERDSVALWWYNRLQKPSVDLVSFGDPYFQELWTYYNTRHRDLWVLDITSDLAIPTFAAISRRHDREIEDIIFGFGAHLDPHLAILRALTEVNQSLAATLRETWDDEHPGLKGNPRSRTWLKTAIIGSQPYLTPAKAASKKTRADYSPCLSEDLYTDVMACVKTAEAKGLETLVVNQTRPDTGLQVVKVVVPGLRHFWPRFAAGRLYDVPVQMGWLAKPLMEDQLNPQHLNQ